MIFAISDSSLRRWCLELKKNGYKFAKETNKNRLFDVYDIMSIIEFKLEIKTKGKSQEEAGIYVSNKFRRDDVTFDPLKNESENDSEGARQFAFIIESLLQRQNEFEEKVLKRIDDLTKVVNQEKIIEVTIKNKE